ncbi:methionine ABC transporter permease [Butyrivibrio sp. YAB3001]|uniref:methionine ABC transporter permease n=1 Tax=Butyrivibrio sp. YAB3001 TaxID=1520812 RepID=UPI0008F63BD6|nr:methionine ABC transporter permease [Butyrivibrio sp. YAB3001]SFC21696.1 D-methionine transport system permease protein [Butyrivibrio sp. YAB3001]
MNEQVIKMLLEGIKDTLYMTFGSVIIGYAVGLPLGILLYVSSEKGLRPNKVIYHVFDFVCNIIRSIPFLILLILLIPFTRLIVGQSYGSTATIVPLVICAAPYIARVVESSLNEVDAGVIEAAKSMGASNFQIITKVLLVEARTSLLTGFTITTGLLLGYSAMSGTVGGGGLGDIAVRYGYYRWQTDIMFVTVILLIIIFQIIQNVGTKISLKADHRKR